MCWPVTKKRRLSIIKYYNHIYRLHLILREIKICRKNNWYIRSNWWLTIYILCFPGGSDSKEPAVTWETWVRSLGWEDPIEKEMAIHSCMLAQKIPWTEETGRLQSAKESNMIDQLILHFCKIYISLPNWSLSSVQSLSRVRLFATPWIAAHQASLSITNPRTLLKLMSIELVMPSSHLILCGPLLLLPLIFPSIRVFSNESALWMRWPKD